MSSTPSKSRDFARKMICVVGREFGRNTKMRIKPGDHQILGNVIEAHQSLRFLRHLFWFDRRVLAAKIKIRLSIFAYIRVFVEFSVHLIIFSCRSKIFPLFT